MLISARLLCNRSHSTIPRHLCILGKLLSSHWWQSTSCQSSIRASMEPCLEAAESLQIDISPASEGSANLGDEECGHLAPHHVPLSVCSLLPSNLDEEAEFQTRPASAASSASSAGGCIATSAGNYIKQKTSQLLDAVSVEEPRGGSYP